MPIYEYLCRDCGEEFEKLVFSTSPTVACEKCGSDNIAKKMSVFASKSGNTFTPSSGGSGCDSCSTKNCGSCGG
jgi:putative FmdB family regulatory protein